MWRLIPGPIRRAVSWLLGAIVFGAVWFALGSRDRALKATNKALSNNVKAAKKSKDTRHEMETSDDSRLVDILTGKLHDKR